MAEKPDDKSAGSRTDKDNIDTLSLSIIPLSNKTLRAAKLVKNARMETSVELHNDPISGSLQIPPEDIADSFGNCEKDQEIINALSALHSYDVYSLRSGLKELGIDVPGDTLDLSTSMKDALQAYTQEFTRPLVEKIFGTGGDMGHAVSLTQLIKDPDVSRVRKNLTTITEKTGIPLDEIPVFLESYSDVFLSVAYYRYGLESIRSDVERFLLWSADLRQRRDSSGQTQACCKKSEDIIRVVGKSVEERLDTLKTVFEVFWSDINKESFGRMRRQIEDNHTSMGAVLCGLMVKMRKWADAFPDNTVGGPTKRSAFVIAEMEPGLDTLKKMENEARKKLSWRAL